MLLSARLRYCCQAKVVYPYIPAKHDDFIMSTSLLTNVPAEPRRSQVMRKGSSLRSQNHRKNSWSEPAIFICCSFAGSPFAAQLQIFIVWFPLSSSLFYLLTIYASVIFDTPDPLQPIFCSNPQYISAPHNPILSFCRSPDILRRLQILLRLSTR